MFPFLLILLSWLFQWPAFSPLHPGVIQQDTKKVIATHTMSLQDRYDNKAVNQVFADNILLTLSYMSHKVKQPKDINWNTVEQQPSTYTLTLAPNQEFAFHDAVSPIVQGQTVVTTNAHFDSQDGFKSDGYLYGDGVCHLASLMYWTAQDAGLSAKAPTAHDFANIPDIPRQFGASIYYNPSDRASSASQNLYVKNTLNKEIAFNFTYRHNQLTVSVVE